MNTNKRNLRAASDAKRDRRHKELIQIVKENYELVQKGRLACGKALIEIRDDGYWQLTHTSFKEYCADTFDISESYAHRLMEGIKVIGDLPKNLQSRISNESQARALAGVPEESRAEVVKEASKNGHITAKSIEESAAKIEGGKNGQNLPIGKSSVSVKSGSKPNPKIILDKNDFPLPDDAIPWWEDEWDEKEKRDERGEKIPKVQDILTQISKLKSIVVGGREKQEYRWLKVTNTIGDVFDSLYSLISEAKPYAVCTTCMGAPSLQKEGCNFCKNTGLISKWQWDTQSRKEVKDMMLRRAADLKAQQGK